MYYFEFLFRLINVKTITLISLTYILYKNIINRDAHKPRWLKFASELPGPRAYPIIGSLATLLLAAKLGIGRLMENYMIRYGSPFLVQLGLYLSVVVSDVNDVQTILTSSNCLGKKDATISFMAMLGNSLALAAPAAVWKHKRKECQPFFTKRNLLSSIQELNELNGKYIEKMKKEVDGPDFQLELYMNELAFDSIMKTHLNYDVSDEERQRLNLQHRLNEVFIRISFNTYFPISFVKAIVQWVYPIDITERVKEGHRFFDKVVNLIRKPTCSSGEKKMMETETLKKETFAQSYVSKLFKLEKELNEANLVRFELLLVVMAASETTGFTVSSCLLALASYPEIQEKVYQEIYKVFGDDQRPIEAADLNKFPYLEQVIKETQRLFTLFPILQRFVEKDTKIGSRIYPEGTPLTINVGGIHHNPNMYPQPYRFNPENFAPDAIEKRHKYSFLPFSRGTRDCLGKDYAKMNMKIILVSLLRVFTFHTNVKLENIKTKFGVMETSMIGYPVSIKLRRK